MSIQVDEVHLSLPSNPSTTKKSDKNHGNARYIIAGVVVVVLAAIVTAGALVGLHIRHADATKDCIMEFSLTTRYDGKDKTTRARIDPINNEEDITTSDGKMRVLEDYNRGIIVIRMKIYKQLDCYMKTLNKTGIIEPKYYNNYNEYIGNAINHTAVTYRDNDVYMPAKEPLHERSFMSAHALEICQGLDIFWMLPTTKKWDHKRIARRTDSQYDYTSQACFKVAVGKGKETRRYCGWLDNDIALVK